MNRGASWIISAALAGGCSHAAPEAKPNRCLVERSPILHREAPAAEASPNVYVLSGTKADGRAIQITYASAGSGGLDYFHYQEAGASSLQLRGDEIRTVQTDLGTLASITLSDKRSFTLLLPRASLGEGVSKARIVTPGITTSPQSNLGQRDLYEVTMLDGYAQQCPLSLVQHSLRPVCNDSAVR